MWLWCLQVNIADRDNMRMFEPSVGPLRRTHHEGLYFNFTMSNKDYTVHAKIGYLQVNSFTVQKQVSYTVHAMPFYHAAEVWISPRHVYWYL